MCLSFGCVRSVHPSSGCVPSDALPGLGHMEELWGRAGLPVSHCTPSAGSVSPLKATASEGNVEKILQDIENTGQRNDLEILCQDSLVS